MFPERYGLAFEILASSYRASFIRRRKDKNLEFVGPKHAQCWPRFVKTNNYIKFLLLRELQYVRNNKRI
jgi:hypothetical protein